MPRPSLPKLSKVEQEFYMHYGHALAMWADLEFTLSLWFHNAMRDNSDDWLDTRISVVFYSARNFSGRADMLEQAFESRRRDTDLTKFFKEAMKRARAYNSFRNKLAHDLPVFNVLRNKIVLTRGRDFVTKIGLSGVTVQDLRTATHNFWRLKSILLNTLPMMRPKLLLTPKQGLQQVRRLPREANLLRSALKPRGIAHPRSGHQDKRKS